MIDGTGIAIADSAAGSAVGLRRRGCSGRPLAGRSCRRSGVTPGLPKDASPRYAGLRSIPHSVVRLQISLPVRVRIPSRRSRRAISASGHRSSPAHEKMLPTTFASSGTTS